MSSFIDKIEKMFITLNNVIAAVTALSIGVFAILMPLDLLLRKMALGNFSWLHEGAEYGLYMGVFLSSAWVLQRNAHVRVDFVINSLSTKAAAVVEQLVDVMGAAICLFMAYLGLSSTLDAHMMGTLPSKDLRIPDWYMLLVFTVSFLLLTIEFFFRFCRAFQGKIIPKSAMEF